MTDDVEKRIADLEREIAELKAKQPKEEKPFVGKPWKKIDYTAQMTMPPSAVRAMCDAVPDDVLRAVVGDHRRGVSQPGGLIKDEGEKPKVKGSGWVDAAPLGPDPSVKHIDRIASHFDQLDRLETAAKIAAPIKAVKDKG
jgi:hypothetical protein